MKVTVEDSLSAADSVSLFEWSDVVFPEEGKAFSWAKPSRHVIARENGMAIAHIGFGEFSVIADEEVPVIGVGGVVVRPEFRGNKIPTKLFETLHASDVLSASSKIFTLFCPKRLVGYYRRHGYEQHCGGFRFLNGGKYVETPLFDFMHRGHPGWSGNINIPSKPW